jgi:hypothetical protein
MKTIRPKPRTVPEVVSERRTFVARLILAEVVARRGRGPLEPKRIGYHPRKR